MVMVGLLKNVLLELEAIGFMLIYIAAFSILILLITWLLYDRRRLIIKKEKMEAVIANIFPKSIADELIDKGRVAKVKYDFVTVMFSDIQGFTRIAETMAPETLVDELDKLFSIFDLAVKKYGIEKIKTIGDAYMCAGGIPEKDRTNPIMVVLAGLEIIACMCKFKEEGMKFWNIKIGIHTGSVVAGVMEQKRSSYDIWGDTVNTANHIESSGETGKINISKTTYEFVKDFFDCSYMGKIPVKYKGELDIYIVNGIKPELCGNDGFPNNRFWKNVKVLKNSQ